MSTADAGTLLERADADALVDQWIAEATERGELDEGVLPDYLAELVDLAQANLKEKVARTAAVARRKLDEADVIELEIKRLQARRQARCTEAERVKQYLRLCLDVAGETRVETPLYTVAIQANGGARPIRWTRPLAELPEAYRRLPAEAWAVDVALAQQAFKAGHPLPDGFVVEARGTSVRIR